MMAPARLGDQVVIDATGAWRLGEAGAGPDFDEAPTLAGLHAFAAREGIAQIWIVPDAFGRFGLPRALPPDGRRRPVAADFMYPGQLRTPSGQVGLSSWLSVWERGGHFLEVAIPAYDRGSPFHAIDFGPQLLGELSEFAEATGIPWKRSGAITSDAFLRSHFSGSLRIEQTSYPEIAHDGSLEADARYIMQWSTDRRAQRCYAFDVNAMYLGAMSSLALPVGEYQHTTSEAGEIAPYSGRTPPGYWLTNNGWRTTPSRDWFPTAEGFWWPEHHRYLEPLYRSLRDARAKLLHRPDSAALEAVKQVYRQGVGRLGSRLRADEADPLYQPYWRHAVIAEARYRLLHRLAQLPVAHCAVDVDCVYFLTSSNSPETFAKRIGILLDDQVGHFKFAGELSGKTARAVLGEAVTNVAVALAALREQAKP